MKGLNDFKTRANEDMDPSKIEQIEAYLDADIHSDLADIIATVTTILSDNDMQPKDIVLYLKHKIDSTIGKPEAEEKPAEGEEDTEGDEGEKPAEGEGEKPAKGEGEKPAEGEGEKPAEGEGEKPAEGEEGEDGEKVKGGLADGMSLDDIATKHGVDVDAIKKEFIMGVKVEMEHTEDEELAKEIAKDHLVEDPEYYTKLSKVEKE